MSLGLVSGPRQGPRLPGPLSRHADCGRCRGSRAGALRGSDPKHLDISDWAPCQPGPAPGGSTLGSAEWLGGARGARSPMRPGHPGLAPSSRGPGCGLPAAPTPRAQGSWQAHQATPARSPGLPRVHMAAQPGLGECWGGGPAQCPGGSGGGGQWGKGLPEPGSNPTTR